MSSARIIACTGSIVLLGSMFCTLALAQNARPADSAKRPDVFRDMPSQTLKELGATLNLTDEQKAEVVKLKKEFEEKNKVPLKKLRQEVHAVRQGMQAAKKKNDTATLKKSRAEIQSLRQAGERLHAEFERNLLAILTSEQKQLYASLQKTSPSAAPLRTNTQLSPGKVKK